MAGFLGALLRRTLRTWGYTLRAAAVLAIALMLLWSTLAIYYSNLPSPWMRTAAAAAFGLGFLAAFAFVSRRGRTALWFLLAFAGVVTWFALIPASNQRDWSPEWGRAPRADLVGDRVTVHDIRDFDYRTETDYTVRYHDQTYDLRDLQTVDLLKSQWAGPGIVHTMLSFGWKGGEHLAVSVETRRERGEPQGAIPGLFKQYELIYVLGEERDLIRLRTTFRGEQVYLYPLRFSPAEVRTVFLDLLARVNSLAERPEFYNTLTENCTMTLIPLFDKVRRTPRRFDIRAILNGQIDEAIIENGTVAIDLPMDLEKAREVCHVNQYVKDHPEAEGFSKRIRTHLPAR